MIVSGTEKVRGAAEEYADLTRESYRIVVDRALAARESDSRLARDFFEKTVEEIQEQAKLNRRASRELAGHARGHAEALGDLAGDYADAYRKFLGSPPDGPRK